MKLTLHVWRQKNASDQGRMETISADGISPDMSFLEMLDLVNDRLEKEGVEPIAFDHDCREGICGMCSLMINGVAHGPEAGTTACQLHMRSFQDGDSIHIEPWRSRAFPVIRDLIVDRASFERIQHAGGYVSVNCGGAPDGNAVPISKIEADLAMDAAACIGCGACVASCPNGSAMVATMDAEGFGACSNHYECEAVCPKDIPVKFIGELNREYLRTACGD
jgi:succinate dehydrogenase / fumarate reductase iron-sulfur subunit